jgi:hypothetical protein
MTSTRSARFVAALVAAIVFALLSASWGELASTDPDRAYHHALSRVAADDGIVRRLPHVVGLHWDEEFVDKEMLFHVVTGLAWRAAGDDGVDVVRVLLGALFVLCAVLAVPRAPALPAAAAVLVLVAVPPEVLTRLLPLRPHVFSMVWLTLLVAALLRRRAGFAFLAGLGFTAAYHAFYVPLAVVVVGGVIVACDDRSPARGDARAFAAGAAGLLAGLVLTPFFPRNLEMVAAVVRLAFAGAGGATAVVAESTRQPVDAWLWSYGALLFVVVAVAVLARRRPPDTDVRWLGAGAALVLALSLANPRAIEPATPLVAVLAVLALTRLVKHPLHALGAGVVVVALLAARSAVDFAREDQRGLAHHMANLDAAARALPAEGAGLVVTCDTYTNNFLLWRRPGLDVLDALEPTFLQRRSPSLDAQRAAVRDAVDVVALEGALADLGAAFFVCELPRTVALARQSTRLVPLWPSPGESRPSWVPPPHAFAVRPPAPR